MKLQEITKRKALEDKKHDVALAIRKLLDQELQAWPADERAQVESDIQSLVFDEA